MTFRNRWLALPLAAWLFAPVTAVQTPAEVTRTLEAARASKAAGRVDDALTTVAALLRKFPASPDAARFQVDSYVELERFDEALKTYDAYVAALKRPDLQVLASVARGDLKRTLRIKAGQPIPVSQALERLARDGDNDAMQALRKAAAASGTVSPAGLAPVISLARLKDPAAETRLGELTRFGPPNERAQAIQAIAEAGARSQVSRVLEALADPETIVRQAAAVALGTLQAREALPQLRATFETDGGAAKMFAAVALRRLGDNSADKFLEGLLSGQIAELRVIAAGAYQSSAAKSPAWDKAVRELLSGPNEQHRLQAAELLACCDLTAARGLLTSALGSPNPLMRAGAAKIYEARKELADAGIARRVLGDPVDGVRVFGAGLALTLAKAQPAPPRSSR